jgi:hypothetical protein
MGDAQATLRQAARDRTSGAAQIARTAAAAIPDLDPKETRRAVEMLVLGHPSMAPLWRLATEVLTGPTPANGAERFLELLSADAAALEAAAALLPPWVVTISFSSSVVETVRRARVSRLVCMESEPGGEGRRMAEAVSEWKRAEIMPDDTVIRDLPGTAVLVGADAVTPAGLVNKVKTRALAEAAAVRGIVRYAVSGQAKFVAEPLPVEEPFELVPLELFDAIVTPDGALGPAEAREKAERSPLHQDLLPLLRRLRAASTG